MHETVIPYNKEQLEYLLQTADDWGIALGHYMGQIKYHVPQHPILKFVEETEIIFPSKIAIGTLFRCPLGIYRWVIQRNFSPLYKR